MKSNISNDDKNEHDTVDVTTKEGNNKDDNNTNNGVSHQESQETPAEKPSNDTLPQIRKKFLMTHLQ